MKTLDEVITALEEAGDFVAECQYCSGNYCEKTYRASKCYIVDALKWLKGYKGHIELDKLRDKCEAENDPLTWDELRTMEGKPVWVEMEGYKPNWGIVMNQDKRNGRLLLCGYDEVSIRIEIDEEGEGKGWQAYRKERE